MQIKIDDTDIGSEDQPTCALSVARSTMAIPAVPTKWSGDYSLGVAL